MAVDSYIESLLRKWGREAESIYLGLPKQCPCFKEYRAKGYREEAIDIDYPEVERLAEFLALNLSPIRISVLRVRYRREIRHKRKAARYMGLSENCYREYFNDCIRVIETRFLSTAK